SGHNFTLNHTYAAPGIYTVAVTVTDHDGGTHTDFVQVTVVNDTLRVIDFDWTASGFDVTFNRPLDLTDLNLYSGLPGGFNPADVTLTGLSTGAVKGSIVWNDATNTLSFVKTGGILAA